MIITIKEALFDDGVAVDAFKYILPIPRIQKGKKQQGKRRRNRRELFAAQNTGILLKNAANMRKK